MRIRPLKETVSRYIRNSTMAFLEGTQTVSWIAGVLMRSGLNKQETLPLVLPLRNYGQATRADVLFGWLNSANW